MLAAGDARIHLQERGYGNVNIKICAYYTPSYLDEILGLRATASELNLRVHELPVHEMTWAQAVMMKPQFILDRLESIEDAYDGLLYTDADSRFRKVPDWGRFKGIDFACHIFRRSRVCEPEMLTGTMYFGRGQSVLPFIREWIELTEQFAAADTPEQKSLAIAFGRWKHRLIFSDIGCENVFITDDFRVIYPGVSPVIEHMQASRTRRK